MPHEGTLVPGDADLIQIGQAVQSVVGTSPWIWGRRLERVLKPPLVSAVTRALSDLERGGYKRYCDWDQMWSSGWRDFATSIVCSTTGRGEVAATDSEDDSVLEELDRIIQTQEFAAWRLPIRIARPR